MDFANINYLAVLVAAAAGFVTGAVWYTVLANPWMAAAGLTKEDTKPTPLPFIVAAAAQLLIAFVLAALLAGLNAGAGAAGVSIGQCLLVAAILWAGFILSTMAVNHSFQGAKPALTMIDSGHWLAVLLVQSLVLCLFGF